LLPADLGAGGDGLAAVAAGARVAGLDDPLGQHRHRLSLLLRVGPMPTIDGPRVGDLPFPVKHFPEIFSPSERRSVIPRGYARKFQNLAAGRQARSARIRSRRARASRGSIPSMAARTAASGSVAALLPLDPDLPPSGPLVGSVDCAQPPDLTGFSATRRTARSGFVAGSSPASPTMDAPEIRTDSGALAFSRSDGRSAVEAGQAPPAGRRVTTRPSRSSWRMRGAAEQRVSQGGDEQASTRSPRAGEWVIH